MFLLKKPNLYSILENRQAKIAGVLTSMLEGFGKEITGTIRELGTARRIFSKTIEKPEDLEGIFKNFNLTPGPNLWEKVGNHIKGKTISEAIENPRVRSIFQSHGHTDFLDKLDRYYGIYKMEPHIKRAPLYLGGAYLAKKILD